MNRAATVVVGLLVLSIGVGVVYWSGADFNQGRGATKKGSVTAVDSPEAETYKQAQESLAAGKPEQAYETIQRFRGGALDGGFNRDWQTLEISTLEALEAYPQILRIYQTNPGLFAEKEDLVLKLVAFLMEYRDWGNVDAIIAEWTPKSQRQSAWFFVQTDRYVGEQRTADAEQLLSSREFEGEDEIKRLVRLALLSPNDQLGKAWDYLAKAYQLDPKDIDVRTLRGRLLERVGKPMLAHIEFRGALMIDPENANARDELADFYRRNGDYRLALITWGKGLKEHSSDGIWLSTLFWSKVAVPVVFEWDSVPVPEGPTTPLVRYIMGLKPDEFWSATTYPQTPQMLTYTRLHQETFWLRVLAELQAGNEQQALQVLESNPFGTLSWSPRLEIALKQILNYRLSGKLPVLATKTGQHEEHVLFQQLNQVASLATEKPIDEVIPADLKTLITGPEAFAAAFLAEGWFEAALQFHRQEIIPGDYPIWVPFELVRAIDSNRTRVEALEFVKKQKPTSLIQLLQAELLLQEKQSEKAVSILRPLLKEEGAIGFRAAAVLASHFVAESQLNEAKAVIESMPALRDHLAGKELMARIEFLEGNTGEADRLYRAIEDTSFVAQSYLAKRAFESKDYERAKELTMRMIRSKPDLLELRTSLNRIMEAEQEALGKKA